VLELIPQLRSKGVSVVIVTYPHSRVHSLC